MAKILKTKSIYYNDINLIAQPANPNFTSRDLVPKELHRIIVSPMDAVVGPDFAKAASDLGLTVCIHRFCTPEIQLETFRKTNGSNVYVSIGLDDWDRVEKFKDTTTNWLIDCANGYLHKIKNVIYELRTRANVSNLMLGNIHSADGIRMYKEFDNCGFNILFRVGIAGGSACSTSDATGVNRGNITEIMECAEEADLYENFYIVADGGIKNGNYAAKAFGAGADFVMLGGFFGKALEAQTNVSKDGTFWGGASHKQQERYNTGRIRHSEGKVYTVDGTKIPLKDLMFGETGLWGGLSSIVSYSGHLTLSDFIGNGVFEIKENSLPPGDRR